MWRTFLHLCRKCIDSIRRSWSVDIRQMWLCGFFSFSMTANRRWNVCIRALERTTVCLRALALDYLLNAADRSVLRTFAEIKYFTMCTSWLLTLSICFWYWSDTFHCPVRSCVVSLCWSTVPMIINQSSLVFFSLPNLWHPIKCCLFIYPNY